MIDQVGRKKTVCSPSPNTSYARRAPLRSTVPARSGSRARIVALPPLPFGASLSLHRVEPAIDPGEQLVMTPVDPGESLEDDPFVHGHDERHPTLQRERAVLQPI